MHAQCIFYFFHLIFRTLGHTPRTDQVLQSAATLAKTMNACAMVVFTATGRTAQLLAQKRRRAHKEALCHLKTDFWASLAAVSEAWRANPGHLQVLRGGLPCISQAPKGLTSQVARRVSLLHGVYGTSDPEAQKLAARVERENAYKASPFKSGLARTLLQTIIYIMLFCLKPGVSS